MPLYTNSLTNPMTTGGDTIYGASGGSPTRLANGSAGQALRSSGGTLAPTWASPVVCKVNTSGTSIANGSDDIAIFSNVVRDTHSGYSAVTGLYTIQPGYDGDYFVAAFLQFSSFALSSGSTIRAAVKKSGVLGDFIYEYVPVTTGTREYPMPGTPTIITGLVAGDTIGVTAFQNSGSARSLINDPNRTYMSIFKVGY